MKRRKYLSISNMVGVIFVPTIWIDRRSLLKLSYESRKLWPINFATTKTNTVQNLSDRQSCRQTFFTFCVNNKCGMEADRVGCLSCHSNYILSTSKASFSPCFLCPGGNWKYILTVLKQVILKLVTLGSWLCGASGSEGVPIMLITM